MLKKTLITTLAAGTLAVTAGAALADGYGSGRFAEDQFHNPPAARGSGFGGWVGGPGWQVRFGDFRRVPPKAFPPAVQKVCGPTYQTMQVWKPGRGWVWDTVYSGQTCRMEKIYPTNSPVRWTPYPYKIH